ncbi:hotdog domain-containing protein [Nocardia cyriacigeorgica]|uniref:hotdog domain-containing protein n=1 Tax=Nocardia cyriacigeorgica TaxID=135487 RepID=UPI000566DFE1|nr:hotdog domain-containing protein [Nocardia cyriacigeorgica]MBF6494780.1 PaaI family thioesterase [Nocardia cyriacigeorgica]
MSERVEPVIDDPAGERRERRRQPASPRSEPGGRRSDAAVDESRYEKHGGFPKITPARVGPDFGPFVEAMRTLQDLTVSVDAPDDVLADALAQANRLIELLEPYRAPELQGPAGRAVELPGRGSLLLLPWRTVEAGPDGIVMKGVFRRFHLGGNSAAHGGVLPLLFDDLLGMIVHYAGRPISRTAYLHVNYRKVTPLETPLTVRGRVERIEGRKTFISAELVDEQGTVLADCEGLMVQLLPWQP